MFKNAYGAIGAMVIGTSLLAMYVTLAGVAAVLEAIKNARPVH